MEEWSTRKDINRKVNDKCSCTLSSTFSLMRLQWNLLGELHSNPSTWKAACRSGLKWLRWGGGHITPLTLYDFTHSWAKYRLTIHQLSVRHNSPNYLYIYVLLCAMYTASWKTIKRHVRKKSFQFYRHFSVVRDVFD